MLAAIDRHVKDKGYTPIDLPWEKGNDEWVCYWETMDGDEPGDLMRVRSCARAFAAPSHDVPVDVDVSFFPDATRATFSMDQAVDHVG